MLELMMQLKGIKVKQKLQHVQWSESLINPPETISIKNPNNIVDRSFILSFYALLFTQLLLFTFLGKKALKATTTKSKFVCDNLWSF
jgi:hypothetical protein